MAFRVQLDMTEEIFQRSAQYAQARDQNMDSAIPELVAQNLPTAQMPLPLSDSITQEISAFQSMHASLRARFDGEYVAIAGGQVVDHGPDLHQLSQRIEERYPDRFVLIRPVTENLERAFTFRSPRHLKRAS